MAQFAIIRGRGAELSSRDEIEFVFTTENDAEARQKMRAYLMGDSLPCAGPIDDRFTLYCLTPVPGCSMTSEALWRMHVANGAGVSEF